LGIGWLTRIKCSCNICPRLIRKVQLHCPGIDRNDEDRAVVLVCALYGATKAAYAGKTRLRMYA